MTTLGICAALKHEVMSIKTLRRVKRLCELALPPSLIFGEPSEAAPNPLHGERPGWLYYRRLHNCCGVVLFRKVTI